MSLLRKINVTSDDSPSVDAFGKWRVSSPITLFDSKNIYNGLVTSAENQPLFFDNAETSGSGTSTEWVYNESSQKLKVSDSTLGTRVRQSKMRFNYQPGKSTNAIVSFNFEGKQDGITKRIGLFDEENGLFLELSGTTVNLVQRSSASGSVVDTKVEQSNWDKDTMDGNGKSGIELDFTKVQIYFIDFEWLGVGRVRMGFVVNGNLYYVHEFNNANNLTTVYMRTPNLPIRSEICNDGTGVASEISNICSTVITEGGNKPLGSIRHTSTNGTHVDLPIENTTYALIGIRLKSEHIGETIEIISSTIQIQSPSHKIEWIIILNPTVADTFNYVNEANSGLQIARGNSLNIVSGGYNVDGGFLESGGNPTGGAGSRSGSINNSIRLGSKIDGTRDTMVLCARPIAGSTDVDVEASITWRELN